MKATVSRRDSALLKRALSSLDPRTREAVQRSLRDEADQIVREVKERGAYASLLYHATEHLVHPGK